jgi:hypothetical protein
MIIIGCDYHPSFQQIAFVDTGEVSFTSANCSTAWKRRSSTVIWRTNCGATTQSPFESSVCQTPPLRELLPDGDPQNAGDRSIFFTMIDNVVRRANLCYLLRQLGVQTDSRVLPLH